MMVQPRKCCRCPRPSEVDSDGRGEKLLLFRPQKVGGVGVDNRLCGEESPESYCAPLYFSHPSVQSQLARKTDTVPLSTIMTQSPLPRKNT